MNIKQAKKRFTELTGLSSTSYSLYRNARLYPWLSNALYRVGNNAKAWKCNCRHTEFWVLLVQYIEEYCEIGGSN